MTLHNLFLLADLVKLSSEVCFFCIPMKLEGLFFEFSISCVIVNTPRCHYSQHDTPMNSCKPKPAILDGYINEAVHCYYGHSPVFVSLDQLYNNIVQLPPVHMLLCCCNTHIVYYLVCCYWLGIG